MKKWHGIEELVDKEINIPKDLWRYEEAMREIPNFDKNDGAKKVYSREEYIILAVKKGYVVYNRDKDFDEGHSHIYGFNVAKTVIDNCIRKKMPKTRNLYLLSSHIRISTDDKYINMIEELIKVKRDKGKQVYRNRSM